MDVSHHAGGVAGPVTEVLAGPDRLSGILVQSHQAGLIAAGHHDQSIAIHQRRLADEPFGILTLEVLQDVAVPQGLAVGGLKAGQVAILGQHVNAVLVDGGGAPGTGPAAMFQSIPQGCCPEGPAAAFLEAKKSAVVVEGALDEDSASLDGDAPIAFSQVGSGPDQRGTVGRPLPEQSGFGGKAGSFRSPPLGPQPLGKVGAGRAVWLGKVHLAAGSQKNSGGKQCCGRELLVAHGNSPFAEDGRIVHLWVRAWAHSIRGRRAHWSPAELKQAGPCPEGRIIRGKRPTVKEDEPRMDTNEHK